MDRLERAMRQIKWTYGDKDANATRELQRRIANTGKQTRLIIYSDLVSGLDFRIPTVNNGMPYRITTYDWTGLDRRIIGDFLGYISMLSYSEHDFMASALVVGSTELKPSWHFFDWMRQLDVLPDLEEDTVNLFWVEEMNKAHKWYKSHRI